MTLEGTNTYVVGREPAVVIDPGPADSDHIEAVRAATAERGGLGVVLLTHSHDDHSAGVEPLGVEPTVARDQESVAGLLAIATPGHAADHFCFLLPASGAASSASRPGAASGAASSASRPGAAGGVLFSGDLILGQGSSIVGPRDFGGSLRDYMNSLERLREHEIELILPGHGPQIDDPGAKIDQYVEHRLMRERRLIAALARGERSRARLLAEVWDDVPEPLRPAAEVAMRAHLEKLGDEGRMPADLTA